MNAVLALARGDFLERVRRYGFLVTLAVTVWAARGALPPLGSDYVTVRIGDHRPLYDSAGVGGIVALLTSAFLAMLGFYLVKGSVERDRVTRVGELLGASRLSRTRYVFAKWLSNLAVLVVIAGVMIGVAGVMQVVLGEDPHVRPLALVAPFLVLTLPVLLLVAAVALVFEMVPLLRGGFGNVAYFFLFAIAMSTLDGDVRALPIGDPIGLRMVLPSLERACAREHPEYVPGSGQVSTGINITPRARTITPFRWDGLRVDRPMLAARAAWGGIALLLALLAARLFDRFEHDRARGGGRHARRMAPAAEGVTAPVVPTPGTRVWASALTVAPRAERFAPLLRAHLALLFKGLSRWWALVALALGVVCLFVPLTGVRAIALPLAAIWPILMWSSMGTRGARTGVDPLLFSSPRPLRRQLLAEWLAGVALAAAVTGAYALRLVLAGEAPVLVGWLAGVLFVPSLALACGVWTGGGKLFEIGYLLLWYAGPLNRVPVLDFLGVVPGAHAAHRVFLALTPVLLALAFAGRARRLRG